MKKIVNEKKRWKQRNKSKCLTDKKRMKLSNKRINLLKNLVRSKRNEIKISK